MSRKIVVMYFLIVFLMGILVGREIQRDKRVERLKVYESETR